MVSMHFMTEVTGKTDEKTGLRFASRRTEADLVPEPAPHAALNRQAKVAPKLLPRGAGCPAYNPARDSRAELDHQADMQTPDHQAR